MDLIIGEEYRRTDVHDAFGGQRQGGISTPSGRQEILIFTGDTGEQYGCTDGLQPDGVFWYTGEGQRGDMLFTRGNLAIRNADTDGKSIHLFTQTRKGFVRYDGQASYIDCRVGGGALTRWPPSAAQTARAVFPHAAFTLMRCARQQSKVSIRSSSPVRTRRTARARAAVSSRRCATALIDATKCVARSSGRVG